MLFSNYRIKIFSKWQENFSQRRQARKEKLKAIPGLKPLRPLRALRETPFGFASDSGLSGLGTGKELSMEQALTFISKKGQAYSLTFGHIIDERRDNAT